MILVALAVIGATAAGIASEHRFRSGACWPHQPWLHARCRKSHTWSSTACWCSDSPVLLLIATIIVWSTAVALVAGLTVTNA